MSILFVLAMITRNTDQCPKKRRKEKSYCTNIRKKRKVLFVKFDEIRHSWAELRLNNKFKGNFLLNFIYNSYQCDINILTFIYFCIYHVFLFFSDIERKEKVRRIFSEASMQQGELNALDRKKKRK